MTRGKGAAVPATPQTPSGTTDGNPGDGNPGGDSGALSRAIVALPGTGVLVGSILTRKYWTVPYTSGYGPKFDDYAEACQEARARKDAAWRGGAVSALIYIVERWVMQCPHASGAVSSMDIEVQRTSFAPLETGPEWRRVHMPRQI